MSDNEEKSSSDFYEGIFLNILFLSLSSVIFFTYFYDSSKLNWIHTIIIVVAIYLIVTFLHHIIISKMFLKIHQTPRMAQPISKTHFESSIEKNESNMEVAHSKRVYGIYLSLVISIMIFYIIISFSIMDDGILVQHKTDEARTGISAINDAVDIYVARNGLPKDGKMNMVRGLRINVDSEYFSSNCYSVDVEKGVVTITFDSSKNTLKGEPDDEPIWTAIRDPNNGTWIYNW